MIYESVSAMTQCYRSETSRPWLEMKSTASSGDPVHIIFYASICDTERCPFTLYSIEVNDSQRRWTIHRRYSDFVRLNRKIRKSFRHIRLKLPPKRVFRNNFDEAFLTKRKVGLEDFMKELFLLPNVMEAKPVREFFLLDNPPEHDHNLMIETSFAKLLIDELNERNTEFDQHFIQRTEIDKDVDAMADALSNLGELTIQVGEKKIEIAPDIVREKAEGLRRTIDAAHSVREKHLNFYKKQVKELTSQLYSVKAAVSQRVGHYESALADMSHVKNTEQKYLFSLLLGAQLSLTLSGRTSNEVNLRQLHALFAKIKDEDIAKENWPDWAKRILQN